MMTMLAYIDMGSGSLLLQMAAAGALGAGLAITAIRDRIVWFFRGLFGKKKPQTPPLTTIPPTSTADRESDNSPT